MKFTATVVSVISHDRLNEAGARVKYKDVLTLSVNAPAPKGGGPPTPAAVQPNTSIAGDVVLHVPADEEWEALQQGDQVDVTVVAATEKKSVKKAAPSRPARAKKKTVGKRSRKTKAGAKPIVARAATTESAGEPES